MKGALLVCGTHSDAGKSVLTAGICRWLHRQGVRVAPFKAQNMSLNSVVTRDGGEIGRAQALQAAAAGIEPETAMNPILIKPSGERHSQVIVMGRPYVDADARSYHERKHELRPIVAEALTSLRERFDVVVCEGAGSPAEINLRDHDLTNMWLAREADLPVLIVGDIDRGGVFASLIGTLAVLEPADQAQIAGFVVNRFRGDPGILAPGLDQLHELTGRPTLGVIPHLDDLRIDAEDSLSLDRPRAETPAIPGGDTLEVAVVRLRWISNFTDTDALASEPGVRVRFTRSAAEIERADLVVIPGTKATVEDLARLRADRLDHALANRAAVGGPILGICGGYQLLGTEIVDDVESKHGRVEGLGLLPVVTDFHADKLLTRQDGHCTWLGSGVSGYEIRHGRVRRDGGIPLIDPDEGCVSSSGSVIGTSWHGILEHDGFRRSLLQHVAGRRGRNFVPGTTPFATVRRAQIDVLGDMVASHIDTQSLAALIEHGVPPGLPELRLSAHRPATAARYPGCARSNDCT